MENSISHIGRGFLTSKTNQTSPILLFINDVNKSIVLRKLHRLTIVLINPFCYFILAKEYSIVVIKLRLFSTIFNDHDD